MSGKTFFLEQRTPLMAIAIVLLMVAISFVVGESEGPWVIDSEKCIGCGDCSTLCVKPTSAVKAVMHEKECAGLEFCPAYFKKTTGEVSLGRENRVCPVDAIERSALGDGRFRYTINSERCIGCGKCSYKCREKGKGAIRQTIVPNNCLDCNECHIAITCPVKAIVRN